MRTTGFILAALLLAGCAGAVTTTVTAPTPPPPPVPFDQAVLNAGNAVFTTAAAAGGAQRTVVIDPLVNGVTGEQSNSTKTLGVRLAELAQLHYPRLKVLPFNAQTVGTADL